MQVFRPSKKVGEYRGFDVLIRSNQPTQDAKAFEEVIAAFGDRLIFINDAEKEK